MRDVSRDEQGKFSIAYDEPKTLRSIRLTETAWCGLKRLADAQGSSRTDIIERWVRDHKLEQKYTSQNEPTLTNVTVQLTQVIEQLNQLSTDIKALKTEIKNIKQSLNKLDNCIF